MPGQRTTFLQGRKCLLKPLLLVPLEIQVRTGKGEFKYHLKTGDISPQSTQMCVHNLSEIHRLDVAHKKQCPRSADSEGHTVFWGFELNVQ